MAQKKNSKKPKKNEMTRSQKIMAVIGVIIILAMILPLVLR